MSSGGPLRLLADEELDDKVWRDLPKDILEKSIVHKLPFSSLVAYRAVSKHWCSEVIPFAAHHIQASHRAGALLHFQYEQTGNIHKYFGSDPTESSMWWSRVFCDSESVLERVSAKVSPSSTENFRLAACEGGLLFFALWSWGKTKSIVEDEAVSDHFLGASFGMFGEVVVSNPLTGESKCLSLPNKLIFLSREEPDAHCGHACFGVQVNGRTGNYEIVVAGLDADCRYRTFCYNSSLLEWADGPSIAPMLPLFEGTPDTVTFQPRSICCNGSLYWRVDPESLSPALGLAYNQLVIKFDLQSKVWSSAEVDAAETTCRLDADFQIAAYDDAVLMWHVHDHPLYRDHVEFKGRARPGALPWHDCGVGSNRIHSDTNFALRVMPQDVIDGFEGFVQKCKELGEACDDGTQLCEEYFAFSQGEFVYHIIRVGSYSRKAKPVYYYPRGYSRFQVRHDWDCVGEHFKAVVHSVRENSYTKLPVSLAPYISLPNIWSFSPSLVAKP